MKVIATDGPIDETYERNSMKIEASKYYTTRDGRKAHILNVDDAINLANLKEQLELLEVLVGRLSNLLVEVKHCVQGRR